MSGYGVYDVEYAQLVSTRSLLEVGVDFLDQDRFILQILISKLWELSRGIVAQAPYLEWCPAKRTWTLAVHSAVIP